MTVAKTRMDLSASRVRNGAIVAFALISLLAFWSSASAGLASLLSAYAITTNELPAANTAAALSANNPEVRLARAALFETHGDESAAVSEYEKAVALRPDDYVLWLAVARANEMAGDAARAIAAAREATKLAPYYSEPHWQLGNILVRAGYQDEGFGELAAAAKSDPALMPGIVDLAWHLKNGDPKAVENAIRPQDPESYRALAAYFRQHGAIEDAIAMLKAAGPSAHQDITSFVGELISVKKYSEAHSLWLFNNNLPASHTMTNPGFEDESDLTEPGFGWRSADPAPQSCRLTLDSNNPREGNLALRVEYTGDSGPAILIISQLMLVQPLTHYQLHFAARSENLVTAGLPIVAVVDFDNKSVLAKSEQFPRSSAWRDYVIDFTTGASTVALQVGLRREDCNASCPIFGRVWLDSFSLIKPAN